ncbi:hypothetical protein BDF14DRAFT_1775129 [Spinellus fusiger]|nr:hypothetical protein BDF14DRAFT_1775129 [Spinellus fusiger]
MYSDICYQLILSTISCLLCTTSSTFFLPVPSGPLKAVARYGVCQSVDVLANLFCTQWTRRIMGRIMDVSDKVIYCPEKADRMWQVAGLCGNSINVVL